MTNTQGFINDLKAATRLSDDPTLEHMLELAEAVEQDLQDMANKSQKQKPSIDPKIDELDKILSEYEIGFITHGKNVDEHLRNFKQAIEAHIDKRVNEVLDRVEEEVIGEDELESIKTTGHTSFPALRKKINILQGRNQLKKEQRQAIKQLRSEL